MVSKQNGPVRKRQLLAGATLIELMAALAITGIVAAAAVQFASHTILAMQTAQRKVQLDSEIKMLGEYLGAELQAVGGGGVRPWHAVRVDDNCGVPDCDAGTDRLSIFNIDPTFPECMLPGGLVGVNANFAPCCLDQDGDNTIDRVFDDIDVILIGANGGSYVANTHNATVSPGVCKINFPVGQQPSGVNVAAIAEPITNLVFGSFQRYYVKNRVLQVEVDTDNNGTLETLPLADQVYDIQFALGFDADHDGEILDSSAGNDEWLFNHVGDVTAVDGALDGAGWDDLRMVSVGIVVGSSLQRQSSSVKLLNRPAPVTQPDTVLRGSVSRVTMRNLALFF